MRFGGDLEAHTLFIPLNDRSKDEMFIERAPGNYRPFDNIEREFIIKYSQNGKFTEYYEGLKYTFRDLEVISWRIEKEKDFYKQIQLKLEQVTSFEDKIEVGKKLFTILELLNLDTETFYLFARILFDELPYLLKSLEFLIIQKGCEPKKTSFNTYLKWFKKNPEKVLDKKYIDILDSVNSLFYIEIKEPRDERIVHKKWKHYIHGVKTDGNVIRLHNQASYDFLDTSSTFTNIMTFFKSLDDYFSDKLISFENIS